MASVKWLIFGLLLVLIAFSTFFGIFIPPQQATNSTPETFSTNLTIFNKMADYYVGVTTEGYLYNGTDLHTYNTVAINQTYRFTFYNYEVIDNVLYGDGVLSNETDKVQVVENHYVPSNSGLYVFWMLHNNAHAAITQKSSVNSRISTTKEEDEAGMTRVASHVSEEETVHTSTGVHESESVHVSSHPSESVHTSVHTSPHTSVHVR